MQPSECIRTYILNPVVLKISISKTKSHLQTTLWFMKKLNKTKTRENVQTVKLIRNFSVLHREISHGLFNSGTHSVSSNLHCQLRRDVFCESWEHNISWMPWGSHFFFQFLQFWYKLCHLTSRTDCLSYVGWSSSLLLCSVIPFVWMQYLRTSLREPSQGWMIRTLGWT